MHHFGGTFSLHLSLVGCQLLLLIKEFTPFYRFAVHNYQALGIIKQLKLYSKCIWNKRNPILNKDSKHSLTICCLNLSYFVFLFTILGCSQHFLSCLDSQSFCTLPRTILVFPHWPDIIMKNTKFNSGLPWWLSGKESTCNTGDLDLIPGSGRSPGEWREWQPTLVFLPGKSHGQRSLVGYSPWGSQRVGYDWAGIHIQ